MTAEEAPAEEAPVKTDEEQPLPAPSPVATTNKKPTKGEKAASGGTQKSFFPSPKQLVTVHCPIVHVVTQDVRRNSVVSGYVNGVWDEYRVSNAEPTEKTSEEVPMMPAAKQKKRRIKIKMGSLVLKMLTRLVRQNVVAYDRIFLNRTSTHLFVRILADDRTVPILLMRCERIGVGNVVGSAYGTPLEWSHVPAVTEEAQKRAADKEPLFDLNKITVTTSEGDTAIGQQVHIGASETASKESSVSPNAPGEEAVEDDEEVEEVSVSSDEDAEEDEEREKEDLNPFRKATGAAKAKFGQMTAKNKPKAAMVAGSLTSKKEDYSNNETSLTDEKRAQLGQLIADARREWLETASRLRVAQVLEDVSAGAAFTFDYAMYVVLAAWVAGMGLISNSVATVVASMLLSPLMGPCLGSTMGFTLSEYPLVKKGLRNECISLVICVIVGFIVALIAVPAEVPSVANWPSDEMTGRGTTNGLVLGIFVAIPSGMGVALSVLGRNSGGLTGVAISLSLLPPAVNAGVCWMAAILYKTGVATPQDGDETDYALTGTLSLCLTLINICCIFIGGCTMFRLKEVAPIKHKNTFWSRDIKIVKEDHRRQSAYGRHSTFRRQSNIKPDKGTIKEGVNAALELEDNLASQGLLHNDPHHTGVAKVHFKDDEVKVGEARRKGLASNAVEDALYVGGLDFLSDMSVVPGGAVNDAQLPDEATYLDTVSDISSDQASLLDAADTAGGLEQAGELLFAPVAQEVTQEAKRVSMWDENFGDNGIRHDEVAGAILLS